jgi:hypothetical protein
MVRRRSDIDGLDPDELAELRRSGPPSPTSTAGPTRRDVGETHLVRGQSVVLIWKSSIATSANQVNSHGYLTKRGTDR